MRGDNMLTTVIRTVILYAVVMISVRLMGKRQIGELQPGELAITILLSEIAAIPIQDNEIPLVNSIAPLGILIGFEIISSLISMKSVRFRTVEAGNPITVIENGELLEKPLKDLRLSITDILAALRQKDVFNIEDVDYAVVETNGSLSVLLKQKKQPVTPCDAKIAVDNPGMPYPIITDGRYIEGNFAFCGLTIPDIEKKLREQRLKKDDVILMTSTKNHEFYIIEKKGE